MNIAKKLLFGLLLGGALFATACGDSGEKAGKGETCTAEKKCDDTKGLICDAKSDGAKEGVCKEKYDQTKCANGTSEPAKKLEGEQTGPGNYCKETTSQPQGAQVGTECADQPACEVAGSAQGLKCVMLTGASKKTCQQSCTPGTDADADVDACPAGKKKCKDSADSTPVKVCQPAQ